MPSSRCAAADLALDITLADAVSAVVGVCAGPLETLEVDRLHAAERAYLETLTAARRCHSYLLGRLAARRALARLVRPETLARIAIGRGVFGQPVLEHDSAGLAVSITHSGQIGAAVAHPVGFPMGIDVEEALPERIGTMQTQFTATERAFVAALGKTAECDATTSIWGAKEALSKVLGCGMTCPFELLGVKHVEVEHDGLRGYFDNFYQYQFVARRVAGRAFVLVLPRTAQLRLRAAQVQALLP